MYIQRYIYSMTRQKVPVLIAHCHLCMKGHFNFRLQSIKMVLIWNIKLYSKCNIRIIRGAGKILNLKSVPWVLRWRLLSFSSFSHRFLNQNYRNPPNSRKAIYTKKFIITWLCKLKLLENSSVCPFLTSAIGRFRYTEPGTQIRLKQYGHRFNHLMPLLTNLKFYYYF